MSVLETKLKSQMSKSAKIARNMNKLPDEIDRLRKRIERINKKRKPTSSNIRDLEKSNKQLVTKQQTLADLQVEYTKIEKKINETKINLQKEQSRNQKKLSSMLDKNTKGNEEIMEKLLTNSDQINEISNQIKKAVNQKEIIEYDVFLSHSSLDKEDYVSKISEKIIEKGLKVFEDVKVFEIGKSQTETMNMGILNSRFVVVFLSPNFIESGWSRYEFLSFLNREINEEHVIILPIWHKVSVEDVRAYNPYLVDKYALNTSDFSIEEIVEKIYQVIVNSKN